MDRDPKQKDITRDPIFLFQVGTYRWNALPDGVSSDGESIWIEEVEDCPQWLAEYLDNEGDLDGDALARGIIKEGYTNNDDVPYCYLEWRTEGVFLTRDEGESYGQSRAYRWDEWRVYCVCAEGELARILNEYKPVITVDEHSNDIGGKRDA